LLLDELDLTNRAKKDRTQKNLHAVALLPEIPTQYGRRQKKNYTQKTVMQPCDHRPQDPHVHLGQRKHSLKRAITGESRQYSSTTFIHSSLK